MAPLLGPYIIRRVSNSTGIAIVAGGVGMDGYRDDHRREIPVRSRVAASTLTRTTSSSTAS